MQTEKEKIKKSIAYLLNTLPLNIEFVLKVAYSNEVDTKVQVFHQIESCLKTEFVFLILLQGLADPGDAIHSLSLPLVGSKIGPKIFFMEVFALP